MSNSETVYQTRYLSSRRVGFLKHLSVTSMNGPLSRFPLGLCLILASAGFTACNGPQRGGTAAEAQGLNPSMAVTKPLPAPRASEPEPQSVYPPPPPEPPNLHPAVAEVARLAKAGLNDEVLKAFVERSTNHYVMPPETLIYLSDLGVAPEVIVTMQRRDAAGPEAAVRSLEPRIAASGIPAQAGASPQAPPPPPPAPAPAEPIAATPTYVNPGPIAGVIQPAPAQTVVVQQPVIIQQPVSVSYFEDALAPVTLGVFADVDRIFPAAWMTQIAGQRDGACQRTATEFDPCNRIASWELGESVEHQLANEDMAFCTEHRLLAVDEEIALLAGGKHDALSGKGALKEQLSQALGFGGAPLH